MANTNAPFGFRVVKSDVGGRHVTRKRTIASGYNTNIGDGDPVRMTGTGTNIARAAAGSTDAYGIFAGVSYIDSDGKPQQRRNWVAGTAGTNIEALVIPLAGNRFEVQTDTCAEGDVGSLADWTIGSPQSNGLSTTVLAGSGAAANGKSFQIDELAPIPGNAYGAYAVVVGRFIENSTSFAVTELVGGQ